MKSRIKRFVAFVFSAVLCLSLFSIPAFAAETDEFVPIDVGSWTLYYTISTSGRISSSDYQAIMSSFIPATSKVYKYTGELFDSNNYRFITYFAQYDSNFNFINRQTMTAYGIAYDIEIEPNCSYIRFVFGRSSITNTVITYDDIQYFEVSGTSYVSHNATFNFLLSSIGDVIKNALEWVVVTVSTITANNILMLFCVALPLCGLGVGMFSRLIRARG